MELLESIVTDNPCYRAGRKIQVKGLMLHSVGCPQPSAEVFVKRFNSAASKVCVHAFVDGNSGKIYQTLPWDCRAWHCGGSANNTHIGVELCEPACIKYTGGASFVCNEEEKARESVLRALHAAAELFAKLCVQFQLNPLAEGVIISHKEGHDRGLASGHGDPDHLFAQLHMNYSMDDFRKEVDENMKQELGGDGNAAEKEGHETAQAEAPVDEKIRQEAGGNENLAKESPDPVQVQAPAEAPPASGEMTISERGLELIAKYEGCRLEAYKCPAGVWTIGYGHTAGVAPGQRLSSEEEARKLLKEDLRKYGSYVNACVKKGLITFHLNQNRFDALTSFCYNCGNGNLQKLVGYRDAQTVADKLLAYNKGGGKVLPGLARRREEERALFLS